MFIIIIINVSILQSEYKHSYILRFNITGTGERSKTRRPHFPAVIIGLNLFINMLSAADGYLFILYFFILFIYSYFSLLIELLMPL